MENLGYLIAAYALVWAGVFVYLFSLQRGQNKLREEIESLKKMVSSDRKSKTAD